MLAIQHAQIPGFTPDICEQFSPTWKQNDSIQDDELPQNDSAQDHSLDESTPSIADKKPPRTIPRVLSPSLPRPPVTCPPHLSLASPPPSSSEQSISCRRSHPCPTALSHCNSSTLSLGPAAYVYTPTKTRTPGFESFRDDHGIVFKKKRNLLRRMLVALRVLGDEDRVGREIMVTSLQVSRDIPSRDFESLESSSIVSEQAQVPTSDVSTQRAPSHQPLTFTIYNVSSTSITTSCRSPCNGIYISLPTSSHTHTYKTTHTMPLSPNPPMPSPGLSPDLIHKLGFCTTTYTNRDRREDTKSNMRDLKNWLDYADEDDTGDIGTAKLEPDSEAQHRVDSFMTGRPAVLVASYSSGSLRETKIAMDMDEQCVGEAKNGGMAEQFVSFPRLEEVMEYEVQAEVKREIRKVVDKKQWGLVGMFRQLFGGGC
ncbi:hypothetical protein BDU57DRAFT_595614 [Ampelomyces quisqualis]|uniref:Uncharacterized protein n=1 Tax=Ampelomyces quisqualis TaxID=50730 RepID=A0A6A5QR59_AMPQU|nr:hypothetical protein BDU57DRAFT_595614 [Ampelomyces quisqualis]